MNKYLVCHSHISVEPEAIGVDRVLSFTEMESVLNEDCILIVSDIVHASLTATYIKNVQKDPNCVYGLSGLWIDVTDKSIENCTTVVKFDRSFSGQRYTTLDYGNQPVHVFDKPSYALNPSKVKIRPIDNCYLFSSELEKAGVPRVVVDTKLWGGPRINMPRFTTFNFKASLFRSLASTEWKVLPRPEDKEEEDESEGVMPDPLEQKEYDFDGLPDVMVMMTTHNRTDTALATIESLVKHLKYPKLKWCICDDRSEDGHVARLADKFFELGVEDVKICRTNDERWGLGASMNNGLRACFDVGPVAFTTEDDWILTKDLDITNFVDFLINSHNAGMIRLGMYFDGTTSLKRYNDSFYLIESTSKNSKTAWVVNNQVALRHVRLYNTVGLYIENCMPDLSECNMRTRYNSLKQAPLVFWPDKYAINISSHESLPFVHIGMSTVGHNWSLPKLVNTNNVNNNSVEKLFPDVTIVIITHNRTKVARETIRFLCKNLNYSGKLLYCISDDRSELGHIGSLREVLLDCGVESRDISIVTTTASSYGLGAALNNGISLAIKNGPVVLTIEDDWILEKRLDITEYVKILLQDQSVGMIRLGTAIGFCSTKQYDNSLSVVEGDARSMYVMVHQVAIRHSRLYEALGAYKDNCDAGASEYDMARRYNDMFNFGKSQSMRVLIPSRIKRDTLDDPSLYFIHVGKSTIDHSYKTPTRYEYIYKDDVPIVTLTSYPGRISNVATSIYKILHDQTYAPAEVHLWLALQEFPDSEDSLPCDLLKALDMPGVFLHWVPNNTFCHKRHEIFRYVGDDKVVFSIDDDVIYDNKLIENTMRIHEKNPLCIINYESYSKHIYDGTHILYDYKNVIDGPSVDIRWCGQSMIPAIVYPKCSLTRNNIKIRSRVSPINDETWLNPWIVSNDIQIINQHMGWGTDIDTKIKHTDGLCKLSHSIVKGNCTTNNDVWLYNTLIEYPDMYKLYKERFLYG